MKVIVGIKRVVDPYVKVRVRADGSGVDLANAKMAINPFCEIAVEEAIRMKEAGTASEVIVVSVGPSQAQEQLRTALALGADRGILVESEEPLDSLAIAKLLKVISEKESADLVILGKQSIDSDNNQTGQMLAALCGWPQGTFACKAEVEGDQTVRLSIPAVVTTDLRLNEPRYASLPNIMKAKKKPIDHLQVADLGVSIVSKLKTLAVNAPAERTAGVMVESVDELVDRLKTEAKVI
jgi:electron transfer flavoprotein beta subunit